MIEYRHHGAEHWTLLGPISAAPAEDLLEKYDFRVDGAVYTKSSSDFTDVVEKHLMWNKLTKATA